MLLGSDGDTEIIAEPDRTALIQVKASKPDFTQFVRSKSHGGFEHGRVRDQIARKARREVS
jgi:hypothetical protein